MAMIYTQYEKKVALNKVFCIRCIKDDGIKKTVVKEVNISSDRLIVDDLNSLIAEALCESGADFASVVENYSLVQDLPFV